MSAELELRWLKTENTKGAVKRFAEFCKDDIKKQAMQDGFDLDKYQDAVKLVMRKMDNKYSVTDLFDPDKDNNKSNKEETTNAD